MLWSITVALILSLTSLNLLEARHVKHLHNPSSSSSSVVVVGTVYCDTCFQDDFSRTSHFISDATVAVECREDSKGTDPIFRQEAQTNKQGEFKIQLPVSISKHAKKIEGCRVELIKSSEPYCAVASTATSSPLHLKTKDDKTRVFSAGFFTFKPLKQPDLCNQVPSITSSKLLNKNLDSMKTLGGGLPLPIPDPSSGVPSVLPPEIGTSIPQIPPIPQIPLIPQIPPIPLVPGIPAVNPGTPSVPGIPAGGGRAISTEGNSGVQKNAVEQPNQVVERPQFFGLFPPILPSPQPAISIPLPPNPLQPPPLLPPLPFQPPPATPSVGLPPVVPIPGLTPPAQPPPTSGGLPFPPVIPGLPLPPVIPGLPLPPVIPGLPLPPVTPGLPLPPGIPGLPLPPGIPGVPLPPARSSSTEKTSTP